MPSNLAQLVGAAMTKASRAFNTDLSDVEIRTGTSAQAICEAIGACAAAGPGTVFLHPAVHHGAPDDVEKLVVHELAHVVQYRRAGGLAKRVSQARVLDIELEAHDAAAAALAGERFDIAGHEKMPRLCGGWPLLVLAALAGVGLTLYGTSKAQEDRQKRMRMRPRMSDEERQRIIAEEIEPKLHQTWWGVVPFVGSVDQMLNGSNVYTKLGGGVFFVLDCTLVGGMVVKFMSRGTASVGTRAMVSSSRTGEVIATVAKPSAAVQDTVRQVVLKGGGTNMQREALGELVEAVANKEIVLMGQREVTNAVVTGARSGTFVLAGTRGVTNHSMVYLIHNGRVFRLHGGVTKFAYKMKPPVTLTPEMAKGSLVTGWNSVTVYGAEHMAGMSDDAIKGLLTFWQGRSSGVARVTNTLLAPGCSTTQATVLSRLGLFETNVGTRLLPVTLEAARRSGQGAHFVLNTGRQTSGTLMHLGSMGALATVPKVGATSLNVVDGMSQTTNAELLGMIETGTVDGQEQNNIIVVEPVDDASEIFGDPPPVIIGDPNSNGGGIKVELVNTGG